MKFVSPAVTPLFGYRGKGGKGMEDKEATQIYLNIFKTCRHSFALTSDYAKVH